MIKNIIFDLGGVLLDVNMQKTADAFKDLGVENPDQLFTQFSANHLFQQLEKGLISDTEFYDQFRFSTKLNVTDAQIKAAWNALLGDYRLDSLSFLHTLSNQYSLFLLSNTNKIHYDSFAETFKKKTEYSRLENLFTKAYFSHDINLRKPDKAIFEFVLQDAVIQAGETLFIDDTNINLPEAASLGIKTHLFLADEKIENLDYTSF